MCALAALVRYGEDARPELLRKAESTAWRVVMHTDSGLVRRRYPASPAAPAGVEYSPTAQGLLLSTTARLFEVSRDPKWRRAGDRALRGLLGFDGFLSGDKPVPARWLSRIDNDGYLWFDRFDRTPQNDTSLSDQLSVLLGLYDYRRALASRATQQRRSIELFSGGLATVQRYLPAYRQPSLISHDLLDGGPDVRMHFIVMDQLTRLGTVTKLPGLQRYAQLYRRDSDVPFFPTGRIRVDNATVDAYIPLPSNFPNFTTTQAPRVDEAGHVTALGDTIDPRLNAEFALVMLDRYHQSRNSMYLHRAEAALDEVMQTAQDGALPCRFSSATLQGIPLQAPWYSAAGEGLVLSALSRVYEITGRSRWRTAADSVFTAVTGVRDYGIPAQRHWVSWVNSSGYLVFDVNAPGSPTASEVGVHLTAVLGIYDYWRATHKAAALSYFLGGARTAEVYTPTFRNPNKAASDVLLGGKPSPVLHPTTARGIAVLAEITGSQILTRAARQLASDYP
jgi:hypothetical protein